MPQSGVGSMQGSNKDCLPLEGHTQGGGAPTVLPIEWTYRGGGRTHNVTQITEKSNIANFLTQFLINYCQRTKIACTEK